jgi:hypothetical protein
MYGTGMGIQAGATMPNAAPPLTTNPNKTSLGQKSTAEKPSVTWDESLELMGLGLKAGGKLLTTICCTVDEWITGSSGLGGAFQSACEVVTEFIEQACEVVARMVTMGLQRT